MKTCPVRFEAIASWPALLAAWRTYRSGKRRRPDTAWYEVDADRRLFTLSRRLRLGIWWHGRYRQLAIQDPKPRLIAVANISDRVVHTALHEALAPWFNRSFIHDTYACLPQKGSRRAILRFLECQRHFRHHCHLDIRSYFPSVDHTLLYDLLARDLRDARIHAVIRSILYSGEQLYRRKKVRTFFKLPPWTPETRPHGLPIGNLTSQWWGNVYLNGLDHFIKRSLNVKGYVRYMDDFVLFCDDPKTLRMWRAEIRDWLWEQRLLQLKESKGRIRANTRPADFLGYRVSREGIDPGRKLLDRLRRNLPEKAMRDPAAFEQSMVALRGAVLF